MGQQYGVEIKEQVDFRSLQTTSSANVCICISRDVDIIWGFFSHTDWTRLKEKHCFDTNAGRVPGRLQLLQSDSQKVFNCLDQTSFWTANLNYFLHLGLHIVYSQNKLPGFFSWLAFYCNAMLVYCFIQSQLDLFQLQG